MTSSLDEEGRHVFYRITLRPWLYLMTLTGDCKIFQDVTVVELLDELLADYAFPVEKRLSGTYPKRDYQTQYNETDYVFFKRLCEEWGIHWFFAHEGGAHRLVLIDELSAHGKNVSAAYWEIPFHALGDKIDEEHIYAFTPTRQLTPGRYATRDYDYTRPKSELQITCADPRPTANNEGEVYEWHQETSGGSHYAQPKAGPNQAANEPEEEGGHLARLRMESLRSPGNRAQGAGQLRGLLPGHSFTLKAHPSEAANGEYLTLDTHFLLEEVAQETQGTGGQSAKSPLRTDALRHQEWRVEVEFEAHPLAGGEPLRLPMETPKPRTRGPQVAVVTGGADNIWTDYLGRVKVQFPWDRYGQKNEHSSCWVRVSSPWAGNQLGGIHLPRIGQEVLIDFIGGDPDLPICVGRVHNEMNLPPWELPGQQSLSGFRSRELTEGGGNAAAGRSNHLVMDDTAQEIQLKLRSDHQASELTLGYNTRIETNAGREEKRGEGYELRTDGHGALRAGAGMLISTEARNNAEEHVLSTEETQERLERAEEQHRQLAEYAERHEAQERDTDQKQISDAIRAQNEILEGTGKLGELTSPHLTLASASGMEATARESIHFHSGEHTAITAERDLSISVGRSWHAAVQEKLTVFIHRLGARIIAAMGRIRVEARGDELELLGLKSVTLQSHEDWVHITGKKGVLINGGGSYVKFWPEGIEHGTKEDWIVHSRSHGFVGPKSLGVPGGASVCVECLEKAAREASALKAREGAYEAQALIAAGGEVAKGSIEIVASDPAEEKILQDAFNELKGTKRGSEMIKELVNSKKKYTITTTNGDNRYCATGKEGKDCNWHPRTIFINVHCFQMVFTKEVTKEGLTKVGLSAMTPVISLAHEMGHALGYKDSDNANVNDDIGGNIGVNENPVRKELGMSLRARYAARNIYVDANGKRCKRDNR